MKGKRSIKQKLAKLGERVDGTLFIKVKVPYSINNLNFIKSSFIGRAWNPDNEFWCIPLTLDNITALKDNGFTLQFALKEWGRAAWHAKNNPIQYLDIKGLGGTLRSFQMEGVCLLEKYKGRALIADEMGLGKTVQSLAFIQYHLELRPVIIICTSTMKGVWEEEIMKWMSDPVVRIIEGTKVHNDIVCKGINIINYDIVEKWLPILEAISPQCIIMDEVHYIKNDKAKRTKAIKKLCKGVPSVIGLSGTPIDNKTAELYNPINIINPHIFPNKWKFLHRYCAPKHNGFAMTFAGASNSDELHRILLDKVMIRRKKKDVLKELPDKTFNYVPIEINNRKEYDSASNDFKEYLYKKTLSDIREAIGKYFDDGELSIKDHKLDRLQEEVHEKGTALARIEQLKQLAVKGKMDSVIKWITDFLESGEKLVIFCEHIFTIEILMKAFNNIAVKIDGSTAPKKRKGIAKAFQTNKKVRLFIGNKAAQEGLTLTAASNVAIIEFPWSPGALAQRIDRVHRISQVNAVGVYYLLAKDSIEMEIAKILDKKQQMADSILDGINTKEEHLIYELIETLHNKLI